MNWRKLTGPWGKILYSALNKYKYVLMVILAGVLLLTLPVFGDGKSDDAATVTGGDKAAFDLEKTEEKLANALSKIDGAGKVTLVLTVESGARQILAEDNTSSIKDGDTEVSTSTVVISKGSGYQDTVAVQELFPKYEGALVVCAGGGDPVVKLKLVEAVSALTGLGSNKISICKGK